MSLVRTRVIRVISDTMGEHGPQWEVLVSRGVPATAVASASAADLPPDIRDALAAWLDQTHPSSG